MIVSKELTTLYNAYKKELGTYTDATTAAYMVVAHVILDLKRAILNGRSAIEKFEQANPEMKNELNP